jgi:hypothetical protein
MSMPLTGLISAQKLFPVMQHASEKWIIFRSSRANHLVVASLSRFSRARVALLVRVKMLDAMADACRNVSS